jgi:flavin reductase (DIM6/NTAB) family NADH-FMN oxidoreductase RutF
MVDSVDAAEFRHLLGQYATGVAIVTAQDSCGTRVGVTINSFTSVSLRPQLVSFSLARTLRSLPGFLENEHLAINILAADQRELSVKFATSSADKWDGAPTTPGHYGAPLIEHALANLECQRHILVDGGDHLIFLCHLLRFRLGAEREPLLFFRGNYWRPSEAPLSS